MTPTTLDGGRTRPSSPASRAFPRILAGARRDLFRRLVVNGALQAAAAIALPFTIAASDWLTAVPTAMTLAALATALVALRLVEWLDAERLGLDYVAEVRLALYDGLMSGVGRASHGVTMSRLMNDLSALKNWVGLGMARSWAAGLSFVGCLAAAAMLSAEAALALLAPCLVVGVAVALMVGPLRRRTAHVRDARGKLASRLGETVLAIGLLRALGGARHNRKRVRRAAEALHVAIGGKMRIAAALRSLPDAILPCAVVSALALGGPSNAGVETVGFVLIAGLAVGPVRQLLRALEYRAAFVVARERLAGGLGKRRGAARPAPVGPVEPGLELLRGPAAAVVAERPEGAVLVTSREPVLRGSLRHNLDVAHGLAGEPARLEAIARVCGLLPEGASLERRLDGEDPTLGEATRARLALGRALAVGARDILVDAPALLLEREGRALLRALPEAFGVRLRVAIGDLDWSGEPEGALAPGEPTPIEAPTPTTAAPPEGWLAAARAWIGGRRRRPFARSPRSSAAPTPAE